MFVVAAVIVEPESGNVLVARCGPAHPHAGLWEFPGGKVEVGETPEGALVREILEELEVEIEVGSRVGIARSQRIELWAYHAVVTKGNPRAVEHSEISWVPRNQLARLEMAELDRQIRSIL